MFSLVSCSPSSHFILAKALRFVLLEKKYPVTFVKDDQADFIQDPGDWDPCNGIVQWEREMGLSSEYSMDQWECIAPFKIG